VIAVALVVVTVQALALAWFIGRYTAWRAGERRGL
jgi:hypothetical protein